MKYRELLITLVAVLICLPLMSFANIVHQMARQGDADAQFFLGLCYDQAEGFEEDDKEAVKWYRLAAKQGHAGAQLYLGAHATDEKEAVKWYRLAAKQGYAEAQLMLGICYLAGDGVAKDEKEAVKLFRLAAEQGCVRAQHKLGTCYEYGSGVAKDRKKAVKWWLLAAPEDDYFMHDIVRSSLFRCNIDLSSRSNIVYIAAVGRRSSEVIPEISGVKLPPKSSFTEAYALDLDTGELFNEGGSYVLTFKDISRDILYGKEFDYYHETEPAEYKFNRLAGTFIITKSEKGTGFELMTTKTGTFTVKKQKRRVF